ncbi:MAG: type V CRISPR-associated protein Cas12a/Cpf1, partial [Sulfurovum sp.]|nr:type V CRISPR-associated protein Cas12a/Cpf1 [Sulfurovum sp.]
MYSEMTKEFSLSKTLRFELKPVFENEDFIENFESEFLKETVKRDKRRAEEYKQLKEIIDDYLRSYIDDTLSVKVLPDFEFDKAFVDYKNSQKEKKQWEERQKVLRNGIASLFKKDHYEVTEKFFNNALKPKLKDEPEKLKHIESFNRFTTYFTGFNENRKNIFTKEAQATAIGYRLIHDNLPKFYDACLLYEKIREKFTDLEFVIEEEWLQELGVTTLDELLTPIAYSHLLTQKTIDAYNKLLGGYSTPEGTKVKGLNEQINLYRQDKGLKARELPTFALLFKQILSEHESASFIPEAFENDKELLDAIFAFVNRNKSEESNIRKIEESFSAIDSDENTKVYIQPKSLTELSNAIFGNWSVIGDALDRYAQEYIGRKSDKEKFLKQNFYPIDTIDSVLKDYFKDYDDDHPYKEALSSKSILKHYSSELDKLNNALNEALQELDALKGLQHISKNRTLPKDDNDNGGEGYQQTQTIKKTLDAYQNLLRHFRLFSPLVNKTREVLPDANMAFYNAFEEPFVEFDRETTALYNKVRNYLSKKPFSREKFKLNFDSPTLLDGW